MTDTCPNCSVTDEHRVRTIAHANRLTKFAVAELTVAIDMLEAGMSITDAVHTIREAMFLLSKMPTNHA